MELRHLRYFARIAEEGNISRAAAKLYIAQPALSLQLRQLEEELGVQLLVRQARGVQLTAAGQRFLEDVRAILQQVGEASARVKDEPEQGDVRIRLGVVPSVQHILLPSLLPCLSATAWETREMITSDQFHGIKAETLDFGLGRPGDIPSGICELARMSDPYGLVISNQHTLASFDAPVTLRDFAQDNFVSFSRYQLPAYFDRTIALCVDAHFNPRLRHEVGSFTSALQLVSQGLGVCILPSSLAVLAPPTVVFKRLLNSQQASDLVLIASSRRNHPAQTEFANACQEAMRNITERMRDLGLLEPDIHNASNSRREKK